MQLKHFLKSNFSAGYVNELLNIRHKVCEYLEDGGVMQRDDFFSLQDAVTIELARFYKVAGRNDQLSKHIALLISDSASSEVRIGMPVAQDVEAVEIEWISNGILVRGKGSEGPFCNYYRNVSQIINQSVGGQANQFIKGKDPKFGDKCILYFGMTDTDSSE